MAKTKNTVKTNKLSSGKFTEILKQLFTNNLTITTVSNSNINVDSIIGKDFKKHSSDAQKNEDRIYSMLYESNNKYNFDNYDSVTVTREQRYSEYDQMDDDPIISSALDIYADEVTVKNETGNIISIISENKEIVDILNILFNNILNVELNLWGWIRNTLKYGDYTLLLNITNKYGITAFHNIHPSKIKIVQKHESDTNEPYYIVNDDEKQRLEIFEVAHFKTLSDFKNLPYGTSILRGALSHWQSLKLMEDAMLIHRITRAPERRIFKIDVGNLKPADAKQHIQNVKDRIKKVPVIDSRTGKYNLRYNVQNMMDDFFVTKRGNKYGTEIETLSGLSGIEIEDIQYMQNKLFAALKIPKSYLTYEEDVNSRTTLATEDERFSKTIARIQTTVVIPVLYNVAKLHLFALGIPETELNNFKLKLNEPSLIRETLKLDLISAKINLIRDVKDSKMLSVDWAYKHIFEMADEEIKVEKAKVIDDTYQEYVLDNLQNNGELSPDKPVKADSDDEDMYESTTIPQPDKPQKLQKINALDSIAQKDNNIKINNRYNDLYESYKHWLTNDKLITNHGE